jgi:hypothetical protein
MCPAMYIPVSLVPGRKILPSCERTVSCLCVSVQTHVRKRNAQRDAASAARGVGDHVGRLLLTLQPNLHGFSYGTTTVSD